jgi:hypothetical protein
MTPEAIHLIYEIAGTLAIVGGAAWKIISIINTKLQSYDAKNQEKLHSYDIKNQERFTVICDYLESIETRVTRLHEDMIYVDNDLSNMEEKIIQLEYRPTAAPGAQGTHTPIQPLPQPIRRMRRRRGL